MYSLNKIIYYNDGMTEHIVKDKCIDIIEGFTILIKLFSIQI